jgi:hypothetical protein
MVPTNITSIGDQAFADCIILRGIFFSGNAPSLGSGIFDGDTQAVIYVLPKTTGWGLTFGFSGESSFEGIPILYGNLQFNFYFYPIGNGQISLNRYIGSEGAVSVPSTIADISVTGFRDSVFAGCSSLTSVTIPNTFTTLVRSMFQGCTNLTNVTLPNSIVSIGYAAFWGCSSLTSITIPNSVTRLETLFETSTFTDCTSLTNIIIGSGLTNFTYAAIFNCNRLMTFTVDENNTTFSSVDGVLYDRFQTTLILFPLGRAGNFIVPNCVTRIDCWAFSRCTNLTNVTIGNGVTNIGAEAFNECTSLTNITFGVAVSSIGSMAFHNCVRLRVINVDEANPFYSSLEGILYDKNQTTLIQCPRGKQGNVIIPASVITIGDNALDFCARLLDVFFQGNAPSPDSDALAFSSLATVYFLPGTTGWSNSWGGRTAILWNPQAQPNDSTFGIQENGFGFNITGSSNFTIIVDACTNLTDPVWIPVSTNTLTNCVSGFRDSMWTNYPSRFYRFRAPDAAWHFDSAPLAIR